MSFTGDKQQVKAEFFMFMKQQTGQFTLYAQNVHHWPKCIRQGSNDFALFVFFIFKTQLY